MKNDRSRQITRAGYTFILVNFLLSIFSFVVGIVSNSIAIASDAIHSLIDSVSGFLIIISEKLAKFKKWVNHRERIERIVTIIIALIIIITGLQIVVIGIKDIVTPGEVEYSIPTIIVLVASIITKYLLSRYLRDTGRKTKSTVLAASSAETLNDTWISVAVLISAILHLLFHINIEAYISIIIAVIIIKVGLEFIFPHISKHHHHHLEQDADHDHCGKSKNH